MTDIVERVALAAVLRDEIKRQATEITKLRAIGPCRQCYFWEPNLHRRAGSVFIGTGLCALHTRLTDHSDGCERAKFRHDMGDRHDQG